MKTGYISHCWQSAFSAEVTEAPATDFGWKEVTEDDGKSYLHFNWFEGSQLPTMSDIVFQDVGPTEIEGYQFICNFHSYHFSDTSVSR